MTVARVPALCPANAFVLAVAMIVALSAQAGAQEQGAKAIEPPVPPASGHFYDADDSYYDEYILEEHGLTYGEPRNLTSGEHAPYRDYANYYDQNFDEQRWSAWFDQSQ